jgi:Lantibiotic dehydratase, N terminus
VLAESQGDVVISGREDGHLVSLPGTEWTIWRDAVLRSAGFPAAGLDRFSAPACAGVADAFLEGRASRAELESAHGAALADARRAAAEIAADPLFREAVTWQNPVILALLTDDGDEAATGKKARRQRQRRKSRDNTIARYWQRYCGKNDTIGFFGPVTWVTLDPDAPAVRVRCGKGLTRARDTYYEFWALEAYAGHIAADPVVRPWLPVGLHPHLTVEGCRVLRPGQDPLPLSQAEACLLARCDGRRSARAVADGPDQAGAFFLLEGLTARGVIWWGVDLPQNPDAEQVLRSTLAAIPDEAARKRALSGLWRLDAARDAVSAAVGHPDELAAAMGALDAEFTGVTGAAPERRPGEMYAGRKLCYEETVRDVDVTLGGPVLDALAGPLGRVLLPVARWLSVALADAYSAAFRALYRELLGSSQAGVPLDRFWFAALPLFSRSALPLVDVAAEFTRRWTGLLELGQLAPGTRRVSVSSADLAGRAADLFAASRPGLAAARIHSPDLSICATSAAALGRGDFTIVLGELHAMWPTLDGAIFTDRHPDPARLRAAAAADLGPQLLPLYAGWCPQFTPRLATNLREEHQLAFAPEPGADRARLLPVMTITVTEHEGALVASARDGRRWPLLDIFAAVICWWGSELFKVTSARPHNPRITIDRLVVARETWRTTVGGSGLTTADQLAEYLAARRLRHALGLPEKVFAKISTEVKPVYLDLTSPRYVSAFATMLRSAREKAGGDAGVVMTELLPGPDQAWLPDAEGQRYFSELRVHMLDPVPAS